MKPEINIVWFKRDLRFTDHAPLYFAQQDAAPVLLLYFFCTFKKGENISTVQGCHTGL